MREVFSMNPEWKFHLGDIELRNFAAIHEGRFKAPEWMKAGNQGLSRAAFPDSEWRDVDLPHDYVIEAAFSPDANQVHGSLPVEVAWYRKVFELDAEDSTKRISLEFDGIYRDCEIWLNGHFVGRHISGYTSFSFDVTELCEFGGLNALAIRVDARGFELWSYEGGGIYRDVRLVKTHDVHVDNWGICIRPEVEHCEAPESAKVGVSVQVKNDGRTAATATVVNTVVDADGNELSQLESDVTLELMTAGSIDQIFHLQAPQLWSPEQPYLYSLKTVIKVGDVAIDEIHTNFGVRSITFDAKTGVSLNGKAIKLKGVCNHQDHSGVGIAITDRLQEWRMEQMKLMGCNAMRTAHNPPTPALLDVCDRLGILVMDEFRMPGTTPELMGQMESVVLRDRNHPSVILWSLGNEEMMIQETSIGARILQRMQDRIHQMDPTRLCTYSANCDFNEVAANFDRHGFRVDVFGANYTARRGEDGKLYCEGERYDEFHARFPDWPLLGGETGGSGATRGLYGREFYNGKPHLPDSDDLGIDDYVDLNPEREGDSTAYNETMTPWGRSIEDTWQDCANRDFLGGTFLWTGFDYRGETYPFSWPAVVTRYGIMDLCGFPKDAFYYHQAWWSDTPMLHIFPHWNWEGEEGKVIDVWCYSNCTEVELFLNGESLGREAMPINGKIEWKVPFQPGKLEAIGFNAAGEEILRKVIETTGAPAGIRLVADRDTLVADARDTAIVQVEVIDDAGRVVPTANNEIDFEISGEMSLLGVGNGDPISHESDKEPKRKAYHGLAQLLLLAGREAGTVTVTATSSGLAPTALELTLESSPAPLREIFRATIAEESDSKHVSAIDGAL
ncbi:MAG: beta-galactosidase GalA [Verrucomicrobiota bacterium]